MAPSSIRWTPSTITRIYQGRGRCSFPINQKASRKCVWSASTTVYGCMFGLSRERRPRRARTFSRPGWGSTLKSSSWPTSKTPSPRPSTSPAASASRRRPLADHRLSSRQSRHLLSQWRRWSHRRGPSAWWIQCFSGGFPLRSGVFPQPFCWAVISPIYNHGFEQILMQA